MSGQGLTRRLVLAGMGAALAAPALRAQGARHRILVVGGGFGGATAARYLLKRDPMLEVTLVEPLQTYVTCPLSNLYLGGLRDWASLSHGFDDLRRLGVRVVHDRVQAIDAGQRQAVLSDGTRIGWDRLIVSPGIDIRWSALEGYDEAAAEQAPHAWRAGPQTQLLQRQLAEMPDGGTFVMVIPEGAYRCPPGPYERASMVAHYFKTHKPASKILLLDGKDKFSKQGLFQQGWAALYGPMIEWVGLSGDGQVVRVDAARKEVETAFGTIHRADVLNVIPPQQAGLIAAQAGVTDASGWAPVKGGSFASALVEGVHVLGDATIASPMPKSGFAANTQAKVAVAAILAELAGQPLPQASYANTCYSLIGPGYGISVAGVYRAKGDAIVEIPDSGGVSPMDAPAAFREAEARYGEGWYASICRDIWGTA